MEATLANLQRLEFRRKYRISVLSTLIRGEVNTALRLRTGSISSVSLGPSVPDVDFELLGLNPPEVEASVFSYQRKNLSQLDELLGERWDVSDSDNQVRFVTQLKITVVPMPTFSLKVSVASARFDGKLRPKLAYRKQIQEHLLETERVHEAHVVAQTTAPEHAGVHEAHVMAQTTVPDTCEVESSDLYQVDNIAHM